MSTRPKRPLFMNSPDLPAASQVKTEGSFGGTETVHEFMNRMRAIGSEVDAQHAAYTAAQDAQREADMHAEQLRRQRRAAHLLAVEQRRLERALLRAEPVASQLQRW
jgi:hypothetical protein